jgi:hypothetical protein
MTEDAPLHDRSGKGRASAFVAGAAIGSAAIVAALLYASRRRSKKRPVPTSVPPGGDKPETD